MSDTQAPGHRPRGSLIIPLRADGWRLFWVGTWAYLVLAHVGLSTWNPFALALLTVLLALVLRPLIPWYASHRALPRDAHPPAPPLRTPGSTAVADLVCLCLIGLGLLLTERSERGDWTWERSLGVWLVAGVALVTVFVVGWLERRRRQAGPHQVPEGLQTALARAGWPTDIAARSAEGHATLVMQTSEGPELIWYLRTPGGGAVPPESVHLMRNHLDVYNMRRGWILTNASAYWRLREYGEQLNVWIRPTRALGDWGEPEKPPDLAREAATPELSPPVLIGGIFQHRRVR